MMENPLREDNKRGKRGVRKGLAILAGREIHKRNERNHKKRGELNTIDLVSSQEAHVQDKRMPIGLETSYLGS